MKIGIGIDTGGTYTDAVIYDFESSAVLGSAKSLTTKEDLTKGILGALDTLSSELLQSAELVSLSTTLATNACVEDRGGHAKLIFFGGDSRVINRYGREYGLPQAEDMYLQESFTSFSGTSAQEVDWELFSSKVEHGFRDCDGVAILEMNAMRNGAFVEKEAKRLFSEKYDVPVVCGHELSSRLNCLQRASSALLNASLFPLISEFLRSIKIAMRERSIHAPVVIVRSDGSLMSEEFASLCPVEMLLCGPAASAVGAVHSVKGVNAGGTVNPTKVKDAVIVDMGGTTTDIALVREGEPVTVADGISIGKWKTFVDGLYIKTFGLGGDSAIHYKDGSLYLEEYRVVPLCIAAHHNPSILQYLQSLVDNPEKHSKFLHEHYIALKDISDKSRYTENEKAFCAGLKAEPLSLRDAPKIIGRDMYNVNVARLIREGVVQLCGLTPTDIMHIRGDFCEYSTKASLLCAEIVAYNLDLSVDELCELVYREVKRKIYRNVVKVLLENKYPLYMKNDVSEDTEQLIDKGFDDACNDEKDSLLLTAFQTDFVLIGIGAPIKVFLDDVAGMLGTKALIPSHYAVANALGAVAGNISARHSVEIRPNYNAIGIASYTVFGNDEQKTFDVLEDAKAFAVSEAVRGAEGMAISRGAKGAVAITHDLEERTIPVRKETVYLGATATAHAVGSVGF